MNDLKRTRISYGRMIRLLVDPLPPLSHDQIVSLSQSSNVSSVESGGRGWTRSQIIQYSLLNIIPQLIFPRQKHSKENMKGVGVIKLELFYRCLALRKGAQAK